MCRPLRDRKDDLPLLLDHFLEEACAKLGKKKPSVPPQLLRPARDLPLPRQRRGASLHGVRCRVTAVLPDPFPRRISRRASSGRLPWSRAKPPLSLLAFSEKLPTLDQAAELLIGEALKRANGNQSIAAGMLGISHQALNRRLHQGNPRP